MFRYGRKVWLTEFARPNTRNADTVLNFMKDILPKLEAAESVWKYSWFESRFGEDEIGSNSGDWYLDKANSLLEVSAETPILTALGKYYDGF